MVEFVSYFTLLFSVDTLLFRWQNIEGCACMCARANVSGLYVTFFFLDSFVVEHSMRTICKSCCSPSTMWVPSVEPRLTGLETGAFTYGAVSASLDIFKVVIIASLQKLWGWRYCGHFTYNNIDFAPSLSNLLLPQMSTQQTHLNIQNILKIHQKVYSLWIFCISRTVVIVST